MGQPWIWDGTQYVSQNGYWTTADMPGGPGAMGPQAQVVDPSGIPPAPPPPVNGQAPLQVPPPPAPEQ
jgi:hypothetical protein